MCSFQFQVSPDMGNKSSHESRPPVPLKSRFQGAIMGSLMGDCLGERYEDLWNEIDIKRVVLYFQETAAKVKSKENTEKGFVLHTDDSCMMFDLGESLVRNKGYNAHDVIKSFAETHGASSRQRNYGKNAALLLHDLKTRNYECDIYSPARLQFSGNGSYGNGSAMRVASIPLFHHKDLNKIITVADDQSRLTHTNPKGINGALLQALAIEKALNSEKIDDPAQYAEELYSQLNELTTAKEGLEIYREKFNAIVKLLGSKSLVKAPEYNKEIGTDVTAHRSVPAALFCFLYTLNPKRVPALSKFNGFVRAVILAVAYSHDSDTVGCMTGAIAGAYYGIETIPEEWKFACEKSEQAIKLADDLFSLNSEISEEIPERKPVDGQEKESFETMSQHKDDCQSKQNTADETPES